MAAAIVGNADLMLGDRVEPVLEALGEAGKGRFRGIPLYPPRGTPAPRLPRPGPIRRGMLANAEFRKGLACLERMGLTFDCIVLSSAAARGG